jgi:hypothetical protein
MPSERQRVSERERAGRAREREGTDMTSAVRESKRSSRNLRRLSFLPAEATSPTALMS